MKTYWSMNQVFSASNLWCLASSAPHCIPVAHIQFKIYRHSHMIRHIMLPGNTYTFKSVTTNNPYVLSQFKGTRKQCHFHLKTFLSIGHYGQYSRKIYMFELNFTVLIQKYHLKTLRNALWKYAPWVWIMEFFTSPNENCSPDALNLWLISCTGSSTVILFSFK